jgi:hypothetical protein
MRHVSLDDEDAAFMRDQVEHWERCSLEAIYEEFRRRGDAPECLRRYLDEKIGRILP